jgi:hypothetical protein
MRRALVKSTEPLPWKADITAADMVTLVWSRLPEDAKVDDVLRVFGSKTVIGDEWVQLQTKGKSHWTWLGLAESWWMTKFFFNADKTINRIEVTHRSDL